MTKILILSRIDNAAIAQLDAQYDVVYAFDTTQDSLAERVRDCEILIFRSGIQITAEVLRSAPNLALAVRAGAGTDNIDLVHAQSQGIRVVTVPEPGATAVAELSFALMLGLARKLRVADNLLRQGRWAKHELTGHGFVGKTLGIVGAGNIGTRVGRMGAAWGMKVLGCVRTPTTERRRRLAAQGIELADLDAVLASSDYLSLHVPLNESTVGLIDARALTQMKAEAFLVNLSRGGVVDEEALRAALTTGRLAGAALDVHVKEGAAFASPLSDLPNVLLTPHIGGSTNVAQQEIGERVLDAVSAYLTERNGQVGHAPNWRVHATREPQNATKDSLEICN
ncbi:MAG: hydroxyacid dehydrogenase [Gammaproteobacteria bacterium]|nr:hydroxyacid dehydrogenase [Gammaproteobacteria bacterium]